MHDFLFFCTYFVLIALPGSMIAGKLDVLFVISVVVAEVSPSDVVVVKVEVVEEVLEE